MAQNECCQARYQAAGNRAGQTCETGHRQRSGGVCPQQWLPGCRGSAGEDVKAGHQGICRATYVYCRGRRGGPSGWSQDHDDFGAFQDARHSRATDSGLQAAGRQVGAVGSGVAG